MHALVIWTLIHKACKIKPVQTYSRHDHHIKHNNITVLLCRYWCLLDVAGCSGHNVAYLYDTGPVGSAFMLFGAMLHHCALGPVTAIFLYCYSQPNRYNGMLFVSIIIISPL